MPGGPPDGLDGQLAVPVGGGAQDDADVLGGVPAERGGTADRPLVGLAAEHGVHDERLQAGVPGTACLGGLGVDLGGGEGDLTGVDEECLAQDTLVAGGGHLVDRRFHDLDGRTHHLHGLAEGDGTRQLARGGPEDVGGDRLGRVRMPEPLGERGDTGLSDETDPGTVLRGHRPVPRQRLVHPRDGLRGERTGGFLEPLQGRGVRVDVVRGGFGLTGYGFGHGDKTALSGRGCVPEGGCGGVRGSSVGAMAGVSGRSAAAGPCGGGRDTVGP